MSEINVIKGDMLKKLPALAKEGVLFDGCICDPPYHLESIVKRFGKKGSAPAKGDSEVGGAMKRLSKGFIGMEWDGGDIAFDPDTWTAVYDTLKPGAFLLAFAHPKTFDLVSFAIRQAGFVIHPFLGWIYGSGFPKAKSVKDPSWSGWYYGTQTTKPAIEPILMAQKPMTEKTGTANVLKHGTGAMNIDATRVAGEMSRPGEGRWPSNLLLDGSEAARSILPEGKDLFFYSAKADKFDRNGSGHPTVKPVDLIRYLVRLIIPPNGHVLDPFAGSGTMAVAAFVEGVDATLIEKSGDYHADIVRLVRFIKGNGAHSLIERNFSKLNDENDTDLFKGGE